jgi:hypothetical protein
MACVLVLAGVGAGVGVGVVGVLVLLAQGRGPNTPAGWRRRRAVGGVGFPARGLWFVVCGGSNTQHKHPRIAFAFAFCLFFCLLFVATCRMPLR